MIEFKNKKAGHQEGLFKTLFSASLLNFFLGAIALFLDIIFEVPSFPLNKNFSLFLALTLVALYISILFWSASLLSSAKKKGSLAKTGIYSFCRHPMYAGVVFLLNPALALFFRSWLLIIVCIISYFIWRNIALKEEKDLIKVFGREYEDYRNKTGCLFLKVW